MTGGVVICLGTTRRNFAAGMSAGIAYVLDEEGQFMKRCNTQMVELEYVDRDADHESQDNFLEADESRLRYFIQKHRDLTRSQIADTILGDWEGYRNRFVKVMPHDYRDALLVLSAPATPDLEYREVNLG